MMKQIARSKDRYAFSDAVKRAATGRWPEILLALGIDRVFLRNSHGPCPGCGGADRFRFDDREGRGTFFCNNAEPPAGDGFALLQHAYGLTFPESLSRVAGALGIAYRRTSEPLRVVKVAAQAAPSDNEQARRRIKFLYSTARRISSCDDVMQYLRNRGLGGIEQDMPDDLLAYPALPYYSGDGRRDTVPAMIAVVRDPAGMIVNIHRTYIRNGDKAFGSASRKLCPCIRPGDLVGAAIRLYAATTRVAITEGIENALAARLANTDWPVWSCGSAAGLESVVLPQAIREIVIWADHDERGLAAACKLQARLRGEGRIARLVVPPTAGMDAADWLRQSEWSVK